jgi:methionyl-tRNA formyltransferase
MQRSKRLVFFGNERLATAVTTEAPVLRALIDAGYEIEALVINHVDAKSRNNRTLEIAEIAQRHNIPILKPHKPGEIINELKAYNADAAVLVAYGRIISQSVIDIFPRGIINVHPSLLPKYRGPTPLESVILNVDKQTGVSIMQLGAGMDDGPVFSQQKIALNGKETKQELADKLSRLGAKMITKVLPAVLDGSAKPAEQDHQDATYSHLLQKDDSILDWSKPADQLEREVRAYAGWPRSVTRIFGHKIIVTKAKVVKAKAENHLIMQASPGFLEIEELIAPSGRKTSGADFIRGYSE